MPLVEDLPILSCYLSCNAGVKPEDLITDHCEWPLQLLQQYGVSQQHAVDLYSGHDDVPDLGNTQKTAPITRPRREVWQRSVSNHG